MAGLNLIALALEDHGGATGFDMMITADDAAPNEEFAPPAEVPEPTTVSLLGLGLFGAGLGTWRRRRRSS